jgi:inner membrane protein
VPSIFAHAAAGAALGSAFAPPPSRRLWITAAVCAALPDIDALGRPFGNLTYESAFGGHRGFTHSVLFAFLAGAIATWMLRRNVASRSAGVRLWLTLTLAIASHGLLDALSTIGNGVAFWAPFSWTHYEFIWQPLGEIGSGQRGPTRLLAMVANELLWVGLPSLIVVAVARLLWPSPRGLLAETPAA